jgi:hypothetical protein
MFVNRFFLITVLWAAISANMEFKFKLYDNGLSDGRQMLTLESLELVDGMQIVNKDVSLTFRTRQKTMFTDIVEAKMGFSLWILLFNDDEKIEALEFNPMLIRVRNKKIAYLEPGINLANYCDPKMDLTILPPRMIRNRLMDLNRRYEGITIYYTVRCKLPKKKINFDDFLEPVPLPRFLRGQQKDRQWLEQSPTLPF